MARPRDPLSKKLRSLRKQRGWTYGDVCRRSKTLKRESLIRLENGRTDPEKCQFATAIQIIEIFFPSIQIQDFYTHWDTGDLDVMLVKRKSTVAQRASKRGFFSDENGELE